MRKRLRRRIIQWFWFTPDRLMDRFPSTLTGTRFDWLFTSLDWVKTKVAPILCWQAGEHEVTSECSRPEHDYCIWCQKSLPGQFPRVKHI